MAIVLSPSRSRPAARVQRAPMCLEPAVPTSDVLRDRARFLTAPGPQPGSCLGIFASPTRASTDAPRLTLAFPFAPFRGFVPSGTVCTNSMAGMKDKRDSDERHPGCEALEIGGSEVASCSSYTVDHPLGNSQTGSTHTARSAIGMAHIRRVQPPSSIAGSAYGRLRRPTADKGCAPFAGSFSFLHALSTRFGRLPAARRGLRCHSRRIRDRLVSVRTACLFRPGSGSRAALPL